MPVIRLTGGCGGDGASLVANKRHSVDAERVLWEIRAILRACPYEFCEGLLTELRRRQQSALHQQRSSG